MMNNFSQNVAKIKPAVVMILAETNKSQLPFTGGEYISMENKVFSKGTGFIVTNDGYILTANHVVKEAKDKIQVRTIEDNLNSMKQKLYLQTTMQMLLYLRLM